MNKFIHFKPFLCWLDGLQFMVYGIRFVFFKWMWGFVSNKSQPNNKITICELFWLVNLFRIALFAFFFLFIVIIIIRIPALHDEFSGSYFICFAFFAVFISIICTNGFINGCSSQYFDPDAVKGMSLCIHFIPFLALETTCFVATFLYVVTNTIDCYNWLELHHLNLNEWKKRHKTSIRLKKC